MRTIFPRLLVVLLFALPFLAIAQDEDLPPIPEERRQEIKAQKTAFLTQRMDLTPVEAEKFWPVYNQYDKELEIARQESREFHRALRKDDEITESEAAAAIEKDLAGRQKELDIRRKYAADFKKTIGAVKTLRLGKAERDFNRELVKRMRDRMQDHRGGGRPRP